MLCKTISWRKHALERMFQRGISRSDVKEVLHSGQVIESYNDDKPYPSFLLFLIVDLTPLHVVVGFDQENEICYVITAYEPDVQTFENDYMTRRKDV